MAEPKLPPLPSVDPEERIVTMPERYLGAALAYVPGKEAPLSPAAQAAVPRSPIEAPARAARPPLWLFIVVGLVVLGGLGFAGWWFFGRAPSAPAPLANANINRPANVNANRPANVNVNRNANANVNAPATSTPAVTTSTPAVTTSTPANTNQNANVNAPAPTGPVRLAADSDVDGLTDLEELLYRANPNRPDTDDDGFLDGAEVFNLYDPAAGARAELIAATSSVMLFTEPGYSLLAPVAWRRNVIDPESQSVAWIAASGEFVQVLLEDNVDNLPLTEWYLERSPGVPRSQIQPFTTRSGLSGVRSPDGFTSYVAIAPGRVLVLAYTLGGRSEAAFRRTYEMMANSLRAVAAPAAPAPTAPTSTATSTP
ncbi:hypothetical protein EPO33_03025 [Patescibacteria group bacterium]|nr:MAG: hypothetical protein EPO33_03025 [Patescibacteria group bacterium]